MRSETKATAGRQWLVVLLATILLGAFWLRLHAIRWGLPYADHPDEPNLLTYAIQVLRTGDPNPHVFRKPSLYMYLLTPVIWLHHQWGLRAGAYAPLEQMAITTHLYTTVPGFFVWGRVLTAMIGSVTTLAAYQLGTRAWSRTAGVLAALFVATAPFHMRHSQFVTTDVPSAWFVALAFSGALTVARNGRWRDYLLSGALAGLAASTKYNAGMVALTIVAAHSLHWRWEALRRFPRLIGAGMAALLGFVAGTPYAALAWPEFLRGIRGEFLGYYGGAHGDIVGAWSAREYLVFLWADGLLPAGCVALIGGLALLLLRRRWIALVWLSFAAPYLLLLLAQQVHFMRNLMPLIVLAALPIGVAGAALIDWSVRRAPQARPIAVVVVVLALFGYPAFDAISWTRFEARPNSQVVAEAFVRTLPRGLRVAVELHPVQWAGDPIIEPVQTVAQHTLEWYRANKYRYLVVNERARTTENQRVYDAIKAGATMIHVFPGDRGGQPGPRIEALDLGHHPDAMAMTPRVARFGVGLHLLGYEAQPGAPRPAITSLGGADARTLVPGESLQFNMLYETSEALLYDYSLFIHLKDAAGNVVAQRDAPLRAGEYPTSRWRPGELVLDRADLLLPALPPGTYQLVVGFYRMETGERLSLDQPEPGSDGTSLTLTSVEVR